MDYWDKPLPLAVMPESGPLPLMVTLLDVNRALIGKLPQGYLKRAHWLKAGQTLVTAAQTGEPRDLQSAFEAIVEALNKEGWLKRSIPAPKPLHIGPLRSEPPPAVPLHIGPLRSEPPPAVPLRSGSFRSGASVVRNISPRRAAEPLWRRILPAGTNRQAAEGQQQASTRAKLEPKDLRRFVQQHFLDRSDG